MVENKTEDVKQKGDMTHSRHASSPSTASSHPEDTKHMSKISPASSRILMFGRWDSSDVKVEDQGLKKYINLNPIVALAGMSVIWPLGDALPPTAIIGRLTKETVEMEESYVHLLKHSIIPALIIMAAGTLMVIFSKELSFLTLL